ncbi:MAG: dihydropteroate synthase [Negativicutes bacterium]
MNYQARVVRFAGSDEVSACLQRMGCDPAGVAIMTPKALFRTICVENVPTKAANLLKQTFLAKGAEVAVTRGTADLSADCTDVLICGTLKHYRQALSQLRQQPWGLPDLAAAVEKSLVNDGKIQMRQYESNGRKWSIEPGKTLVMGILNLTPDSFSDGGRHNSMETAVERALTLVCDGADMLDVGAESTRPYGAVKISADEEMTRLMPVLKKILASVDVPVSVDTYKSEVAECALKMGAHVLNDVWGLHQDPNMARVAATYGVPVIVMHNRSSSESTRDIMSEMSEFFVRSVEIGMRAGIDESRFIVDPGIGFGKNSTQNLEILGRLAELKALGYPILVGASRKRFIGDILGLPVEERDEGTGATVVHSILNGASIVRVHDVKMAKRMAVMTDALQGWRSWEHG